MDRDGVTADGCAEVESKLFDLFANMGATDDQLDFAVVYASASEGVASLDLEDARRACAEGGGVMSPLLDVLLARVPSPPGSPEEPFRMLVSMIEHDAFVGRLVTGRVASGRVEVGDRIKALPLGGDGERESGRVTKLFTSRGGVAIAAGPRVRGRHRERRRSEPRDGHGHGRRARGERTSVGVPDRSPDAEDDLRRERLEVSAVGKGNTSPVATSGTGWWRRRRPTWRCVCCSRRVVVATGSKCRAEASSTSACSSRRCAGKTSSSRCRPPPCSSRTTLTDRERFEPLEEVLAEVEEEHVGGVIEALSLRKGRADGHGPRRG